MECLVQCRHIVATETIVGTTLIKETSEQMYADICHTCANRSCVIEDKIEREHSEE